MFSIYIYMSRDYKYIKNWTKKSHPTPLISINKLKKKNKNKTKQTENKTLLTKAELEETFYIV